MIPAVLSCVFVLYLYRTLNEPAQEASNSQTANSVNETVELTSRLEALQQRVERLVESRQRGEE
ncbi:MAG: hypothetical protein NXI32_12200 [bacterium]|nr:hypothetical protein [bacterium]